MNPETKNVKGDRKLKVCQEEEDCYMKELIICSKCEIETPRKDLY